MISQKYAKLLFEEAKHSNVVPELQTCYDGIVKDPLVARFFISSVDRHVAEHILSDVMTKCKIGILISNFMRLIVRHGRIRYLPQIIKEYHILLDSASGHRIVEVTSATALNKEDKSKIEVMLGQKLNGILSIKYYTNHEIIGGIIAKSGSLLLDASIKDALRRVVNA